jgi:hypothetical protein
MAAGPREIDREDLADTFAAIATMYDDNAAVQIDSVVL